jgi:FkbM family methyltransferase
MLQSLRSQYRDIRTFGAGSLLRHFAPAQTNGQHILTVSGGYKMSVREGTTDIDVLRQVFQHGDYDLTRYSWHYDKLVKCYHRLLASGKESIIVDAGANIGAASVYFASLFPKARILAVEPEPQNAECCRSNCREIEKVAVFEAAIGSAGGAITLTNPNGQAWAPRTERSKNGEGIDVVTIPQLAASVANGALFIVKIDIEGFESDLFTSNLGWIDEAQVIIVEVHDWMLPGKGTSRALQQAMGTRNFEMVLSGENLIYFNQGAGLALS